MVWFRACVAVALIVLSSAEGWACEIRMDHPETAFPFDKMDRQALCRLAGVINDHTTSRLLPSLLTPMHKPLYDFFLDHMTLTASLVRTLALGGYRVKRIGPRTFQGDDGEGSEAQFDLLYQDPTHRAYHIQGKHRGKVFGLITGEAVILLSYHGKAGPDGKEQVDAQVTAYSKLDNPVLAALVRVLEPLLRETVNGKLAEPFLVVHRLGETVAADQSAVFRQADTSPDADRADVEELRELLLPAFKRDR